MKYSVVSVAALATLVVAQPSFLNSAFDVQEGEPFTLNFSGCEGGCTIVLQNGESDDLKDVTTLTTTADGDSFTWTPEDLPSDTYNFKITNNDSGEENYSAQFEYEGTGVIPTGTTTGTNTVTATVTGTVTGTTTASATVTESDTTVVSETTLTSTGTFTATATETETETSTLLSTSSAVSTVSTVTRPSSTVSESEAATSATASATTVPDSGASRMTSSLALVAGAIMAMVYLN